MAYIPNPVDILEPVISRPAGSAAEEFRKLKEYLQTLVVNAGKSTSVRQTVLQGVTDSNGYANMLSAGTGLTVKLTAAATAIVFAFAAGHNATLGAVDNYAQLTADTDPVVSAISASNTSFIAADYVSASSVTWDKTLVPPQYGNFFDCTQNSLLHFDGTDASTTVLDDFGNTWAVAGNAQLDTAQQKFGSASLLLDGTGDYVESTNFTTLGGDSWEMSCWFRLNATSVLHGIMDASNATGFGVAVWADHNAGTRRLAWHVSSNGTTNDVVNGVVGTTTLSLATWYKVRVVFDALAGTYRMYLSNNGAAETQENTTSSTARVCAITHIRLGDAVQAGISDFNGWLDEFRLLRAASATALETPKATAFAVNETGQLVNFFSIPEMKMYEVTAASSAAGVNPTLTARNRVFVAEADTSGAAVTAVRNYAIRGKYVSADVAVPAVATTIAFAANIGTRNVVARTYARCVTSEGVTGHTAGNVVEMLTQPAAGYTRLWPASIDSRNSVSQTTGVTAALIVGNRVSGNDAAATSTSWRLFVRAERGW